MRDRVTGKPWVLEGKELVFVINHAYGKFGERIEILEIKDNEFFYIRSMVNEMQFNREAMGKLNALHAYSEHEIYVTQFMPTADDRHRGGFDSSISYKLRQLADLIGLKYTAITTKVFRCITRPGLWDKGDIDADCENTVWGKM